MVEYSAQILNLFYSTHFPSFNSSVDWVGNLVFQDWQCPQPLSNVIRMRLLIRQSNLPACLAWAKNLWNWQINACNPYQFFSTRVKWIESFFMPVSNFTYSQNWWNLQITDAMDEIHINGKFLSTGVKWMEIVLMPVSSFTVFQPGILTDFRCVELGQVRLFENRSGQVFERYLKVFSRQLNMKMVKYEEGMLIWGQNYIFCGHSEVNFSVWFVNLRAWIFQLSGYYHRTEPGSLLPSRAL